MGCKCNQSKKHNIKKNDYIDKFGNYNTTEEKKTK